MRYPKYYHTQEKRKNRLSAPMKCTSRDAWLGHGYYYWADEDDAIRWGRTSKTKTRKFEIYISEINEEDIIDTVFNRDHYYFWLKQIEKIAKILTKKLNIKPTIREINNYIASKNIWKDVNGIKFQDLPKNENYILIEKFYYRKRIQLAVYNDIIIKTFNFYDEGDI